MEISQGKYDVSRSADVGESGTCNVLPVGANRS